MSHLLTLENIAYGDNTKGFGLFSTPIRNPGGKLLDYQTQVIFLEEHYMVIEGSRVKHIRHDEEEALSLAYGLVKNKIKRYQHSGDKFEDLTSREK